MPSLLEHSPLRRLQVRKVLHLAVGLLALALAAGPWVAVALTAGLSVFNAWIWPRLGGRVLWRDPGALHDIGILSYPLVLLGLTLCLHRRLDIVAAAWGILAFGDGMAALVGSAWGRRPLPWNPHKSWLGLSAHVVFGGFAAWGLLVWMRVVWGSESNEVDQVAFLAVVALLAASLAAAVESLPLGLDDNLTAPPLAALFLWGGLESRDWWLSGAWQELLPQAGWALLVAVGLAVSAYRARSVDLSGALAGALLSVLIATFLGWPGFLLFGAFFVLGSGVTRVGYRQKARRGLAQERSGRRSARNALANVGVPAVLGIFAATTPWTEPLTVAFCAALAAATADTVSSEIGQLWGGRPVLITTWKAASPGCDGGITWVGSGAGLVAGAVMALLAWMVGLCELSVLPWIIGASLVGNLLDSLLGATLESAGLLDNEAVNFAATLGAALTVLASSAVWV